MRTPTEDSRPIWLAAAVCCADVPTHRWSRPCHQNGWSGEVSCEEWSRLHHATPPKTQDNLHCFDNRGALDLAPRRDSSQRDEIERLVGLGATTVNIGQAPAVPWRVLADPEGNEFCVLADNTP